MRKSYVQGWALGAGHTGARPDILRPSAGLTLSGPVLSSPRRGRDGTCFTGRSRGLTGHTVCYGTRKPGNTGGAQQVFAVTVINSKNENEMFNGGTPGWLSR